MDKHPLHIVITQYIEDQLSDLWGPNIRLIKDQACGGRQQIPLFLNKDKSRKTELCKVDLAIIKGDRIEILIEIDTKIIPTQICGKFLTSALSSFYIHRTEPRPVPLSDNVLFIQILDSELSSVKEKDKTAKIEQGRNIQKAIQVQLQKMDSKIKDYRLLWASEDNIGNIGQLVEIIKEKIRL